MKDFFAWLNGTNNGLVVLCAIVFGVVAAVGLIILTVDAAIAGYGTQALLAWLAVPAGIIWKVYVDETRK
jgi:hypothetical protein